MGIRHETTMIARFGDYVYEMHDDPVTGERLVRSTSHQPLTPGRRPGKAHHQALGRPHRPTPPIAGPWKRVHAAEGMALFHRRPRRTDPHGVKRARRRARAAKRRALVRARRQCGRIGDEALALRKGLGECLCARRGTCEACIVD